MLEVSGLRRKYGDFLAVDGVTFSIGPGEIVGLLGHNGAGKTTIMKMLSGFLEPDEGRVRINGVDISADPKEVQKHLGYLPENLPVYPEMTVADYLDYAAELKGLAGDTKRAEIRRVVRETDIADKFLSPIGTLSRGYRQRVGVAQAILGHPRLLILDEPTNGLDPTQTLQMRNLIRRLAERATVIISTHIMQEVEALCSRVLIVSGGRLEIDEKLDDLKLAQELEVETSLEPALAQELLAEIPGVRSLHAETAAGGVSLYRLTLAPGANRRDVASHAAAGLIQRRASLYRLSPVMRNLESLFREVSGHGVKEDLSDAA